MSAEAIFFFTGKAIWVGLCVLALILLVVTLVAVPIYVFTQLRWKLWKWILAAKLAKEGFTEADIRFAFSLQGGGLPCDFDAFIEAVQRIKTRGDVIKKRMSEPISKSGGVI